VLVQWDHGTPGVTAVMAEAALLFLEQDDPAAAPPAIVTGWLSASLKAAECAWQRGLLTKGLGWDEAGGLKGRARVRLPLISASGSAPLGSS
jgi:hypothetical protein